MDISHLEELDQGIRVSDIAVDPGITILSDPNELVARVSPPRVEVEAEVEAGRPAMAEGEREEKAEEGN